jgi:hypothetical protein
MRWGVGCLGEPDLRGVHAEGSEEAHAALHLVGVEVLPAASRVMRGARRGRGPPAFGG